VSLDLEGIAVSGGSACGSDSGLGSSVLDALGLDVKPPYATIRFSFGAETSRLDIDRAVDALARIAGRVHSLSV
jgi:cysteine desulfurase